MLIFAALPTHDTYMKRCLELALLGAGSVAPNPMVGAVLVHDDNIIGEGYHQQYGQAHAEVNCIDSVPEHMRAMISKSTLYVSLEPCNHFGKTPPCSDLIISHSIPRVVIGCIDPFEKVNGSGIQKLKQAGITVEYGVLEKEARELNKRFFTFHTAGRPYIVLKWAQSSNGKIAAADERRILVSNEYSNRLVHKWRSEETGIMIGTRTALLDDPSLTTRLWKGKNPVRIIVDRYLQLPRELKVFDGESETVILNTIKDIREGKNRYCRIDDDDLFLDKTLRLLYELNIDSILVEGGSSLLQSFIDSNCWDEARVITNRFLVVENGLSAPRFDQKDPVSSSEFFTDKVDYYYNTGRF